MVLKRDITIDIERGAQYFPVIALVGPRQSGKTTLAQLMFKNHTYITLEDLDIRALAIRDPRTFLLTNSNEYGIIIDEFQHVPGLLSYIQTIVDREQKPGYFVLTGSQNFLMNQAISQTLAGRVSIHTLLPLSVNELAHNDILPDQVETILFQGCYPALYAKNIPPDLFYKNYIKTYIERDVLQLTQVGDLTIFQTFITLCAARTGQLLNITSLGNECGISDTTVKRWLSILETSYIIFILRPYHTSFGKRLVKTPKIYFYDPGLVSFLLRIRDAEELVFHPIRGHLFESFIIAEILKWYHNNGKTPNVYFWRDQADHEIDALIEEGRTLIPLEIKAGRTISARFFEGLEYWNSLAEEKPTHGFVVFAGSADQPRGYANVVSWQSINKIFTTIHRRHS